MKNIFLTMKAKHKNRLFLCLLLALFSSVSFSQTKDETAIRNVLQAQEIAWNKGDLEKYMQGYWKNDSVMFIGKSGITYGWQKTLDNYKKGYPNKEAMGKLNFTLLEIKPISAQYYFVVGKWHLQRTIGNLDGIFTLLFKKINGEWVIVADHSS
jgi:ketosteroid isomerase-like protein